MSDEKGNGRRRKVPDVKLNLLATASTVEKDLLMTFPASRDNDAGQSLDPNDRWILEVSWKDVGLSKFAAVICKADLDRVPIGLDPNQTEKLWSYLAFYWKAFLYNKKQFYDKEHKAPDFAIVSALFRETEWSAIGLIDKSGLETRKLLAQAMNLLYYTRYADVVHAHFIVELQMIFATLRKQEEGPDEPPRHVSQEEKNGIKNNWLTFCNFLSLVSDIDRVQGDLSKQINVRGDLRLMVQSLMKYVSFGLQYVYANVKKMPKGEELCRYSNYYDPAYGDERVKSEFSCHTVPSKPYLLTQSGEGFRILPNDDGACTAEDEANGIRQFAQIFVNPYFQAILTYFDKHCMKIQNCRYRSGPVKSVERMLQKADDLKSTVLSLHDICRASFCVQLPSQMLLMTEKLKESPYEVLKQLEVIRIRNLFNEDEKFLKNLGKNKNSKIWSEEGITHYRNLKIDVKILLPETVTYIDPKGNRFIGDEFIGEIELLMDSYLYAKKETHKYWKLQRIRKSKDLLNLPLWEHPDDEEERKDQRSQETLKLLKRGALLRRATGREECWRSIKADGKEYIKQLNAMSKNKGDEHEIRCII